MSVMRQMVRGYTWKCRMSNGAEFEWWTPMEVTRAVARAALFKWANSIGFSDEPPVYEKCDMESLWRTKG